MKTITKVLYGIVFVSLFAVILPIVQVSAKPKKLEQGKTYKYDLDGDGKKEKIRYEAEYELDELSFTKAVHFYINDKMFSVETKINEDGYSSMGWAYIYVTDINTSDKYKDLDIYLDGEEWPAGDIVLRYESNKLRTLFTSGGSNALSLADKQKSGNTVIAIREVYSSLGQTQVFSEYKIKNKKMVEKMPEYCTLEVSNKWMKKYWYELAKEADVYKKPDGNKVVKTLKKGNKFRISAIRMVNGEPAYVQISIKGSKNIGWIKIQKDSYYNDPLVVNRISYA